MNFETLAVVIGPVVVTAVLGPVLMAVMNKARQRAESENYEVQSDKARFEAMDLLVNHLRIEVDRLRQEASSERGTNTATRARVTELERISVDLALWSLSLVDLMERAGMAVPKRPKKIQGFLNQLP